MNTKKCAIRLVAFLMIVTHFHTAEAQLVACHPYPGMDSDAFTVGFLAMWNDLRQQRDIPPVLLDEALAKRVEGSRQLMELQHSAALLPDPDSIRIQGSALNIQAYQIRSSEGLRLQISRFVLSWSGPRHTDATLLDLFRQYTRVDTPSGSLTNARMWLPTLLKPAYTLASLHLGIFTTAPLGEPTQSEMIPRPWGKWIYVIELAWRE